MEKIRKTLPLLDEMISDDLITSERVETVAYRTAPKLIPGARTANP